METSVSKLYEFVQARPRPEEVAWHVRELVGPALSRNEFKTLSRAADLSLASLLNQFSSMAADFLRPSTRVAASASVAAMLFAVPAPGASTDAIEAFVREVSAKICREHGQGMRQRLGKVERREAGIFKNARWYNKRFRLLCRIEKKLLKLAWEERKYAFIRIGKSGFATQIERQAFEADLDTACLVAYLSARMSLRSTFTNQSQVRAFDEIAEMLLKRCEASKTTRWEVVAAVLPDQRILKHLYDGQKATLLARAWDTLADMADFLRRVWDQSKFNRTTMVVTRGNDSSTWNQVAGGWNKARDHWIQTLYALGMESVLDRVCVGKVMRLMAADVARWHQVGGAALHPDTAVWAALPAPWEVFSGEKQCTRQDVEQACSANKADARSWTGRRDGQQPTAFTPTPELVHGVVVASPSLAKALRTAGVFSGKEVAGELPEFDIARDINGFALRAR